MQIIDIFVLAGSLQAPTVIHPVTQAARLWCSAQSIGEWAGDVLTVASLDHLAAIINSIPDNFQTITM
jgi:hypothetical protein